MSVHGYPADKSILLQLETRLTEVTRRERCSWSRSLLLFHTSVRASLLGDNMRCFQRPLAVSVQWTQFLRSSNRLLGSMLVIFLRGGLWPAGACAFHIQPAKRTLRSSTRTCSFPTTFVLPVAEIVNPMCDKMIWLAQFTEWRLGQPIITTGVPTVSYVGKK